jgi:hypothetical protein
MLAPVLEAFFTERLQQQRRASPHTIAAYRDTFRLLLAFAEKRLGKAPSFGGGLRGIQSRQDRDPPGHRYIHSGGGIMIHRRVSAVASRSCGVRRSLMSRIRREPHRSPCKQRSSLLAMRTWEHAAAAAAAAAAHGAIAGRAS